MTLTTTWAPLVLCALLAGCASGDRPDAPLAGQQSSPLPPEGPRSIGDPSAPADRPAPSRDAHPRYALWPQQDSIETYTLVSTGVVYVDAPGAEIVWESWDHDSEIIGLLGDHAVAPDVPGVPWGNTRDVVGNPLHDLVVWVEVVGEHAEHVVVVEASTGRRLATTDVRQLAPGPVIIGAVDQESVSFAAPSSWNQYPFQRDQVWTWRWTSGEPPSRTRSGQGTVLDVSGDIWAVAAGGALRFEDASGELVSQVPASYEDRTSFGGGLSPDGRYWFGPAYGEVVETRTGALRGLGNLPPHVLEPSSGADRFGWTDASTMTFLAGGAVADCDATTGACTLPTGQCDFAYCRKDLPTN